MIDLKNYPTPQKIVSFLDKYIIGQDDAKRNVAIALRNRWRRMCVSSDLKGEIMPNNILMIGSTGVGKTEIARRLAKISDSPFIKVEASKFTEVGYVGRDVESMVRDLVEQAVSMVRTNKQEEVKEKAHENVEEILLDILIPPIKPQSSESRDTTMMPAVVPSNEKTREEFRKQLRDGTLDDKKVEIEVQHQSGGAILGGVIDEPSLVSVKDMLQNLIPNKRKKKKITIGEAKKILLEEESSKLIDPEAVKEEALEKTANSGIIFIDEIDKIATGGNKGGADISREGVQRDLLPIVEGSAVNTKYGIIKTDHILFIAAGAFHDSKPSDLIPELQGRFPIRVELESLTKDDFYRILTEPKNSLTKQYQALFEAEEVSIIFHDDAVKEIAHIAFQLNEDLENIGARRLHTVMSHLLNNFLFEVPASIKPNTKIDITKDLVKERLEKLSKQKDMSEYIL